MCIRDSDRLLHKSRSTPCFCAFVGRWREVPYVHSHQDIIQAFQEQLKTAEELPEVLAHGMGNFIYLAKLEDRESMEEFFRYTLEAESPKEETDSLQKAAPENGRPADENISE